MLAIVLLAGCSSGVEPEVDARRQAFVGGRSEPEPPGVGYLVRDGVVWCTGSLVEPDLVLTAAHCCDDPDETIEFGWGEPSAGRRVVAIARALHPRYIEPPRNGGVVFQGFDVALVRLAHAVDVPTIPIGAAPSSGRVRAVGYGATSYAEDARGEIVPRGVGSERRAADGIVIGANPTELFVRFELGSSACYGDSGSPLFVDDGAAVGVLSRFTGTSRCEPRLGSLMAYTRVDRMGDFFHAAKVCLDREDVAGCLREDERQLCDPPRFTNRAAPLPLFASEGDLGCGSTSFHLDAHEERAFSVEPPVDVELSIAAGGDASMTVIDGAVAMGARSDRAALSAGRSYEVVVRSCNGARQTVEVAWASSEARDRFPCAAP